MRPLRAGLQRHRVELQGFVETVDSFGGVQKTWTTLATFWAEVRPLRGSEFLRANQVWAAGTYFVNFRWLGSNLVPDPTHRIKVLNSGKLLNIVAANNVEERNRSYELVCEQKVEPPS